MENMENMENSILKELNFDLPKMLADAEKREMIEKEEIEKEERKNKNYRKNFYNNYKSYRKELYFNIISLFVDLPRFKNCCFENFKDGDKYIEKIRETKDGDFLLLTGGAGRGKTHLSISYAKFLLFKKAEEFCQKEYKEFKLAETLINFITLNSLLLEIRSTYNDSCLSTESEIIKKYSEIPILIIDDIGVGKVSEFTIDVFYNIINGRYNKVLTTIFTSNMGLKKISDSFSDRIASRLSSGNVINIDKDDYRLK